MPWALAIDGSKQGLTDVPLTLIRQGNFNNVPVIMGTNKNEGSIFIPMMPIVTHTLIPLTNSSLYKVMGVCRDCFTLYVNVF